MDQARDSRKRFVCFTERDAALVRWRFDRGYVAGLAKRRYRKMFKGAKRILDIGCGVGKATKWANGSDYFGIDLSEALIRIGIKEPDRYLAVASVNFLPFPRGTFDCVTCMGVLHHLPKGEIAMALNEMTRILKMDGVIAIIEPNPWNFYQRLFAYIRPAERGILNTSPRHLRCIIDSIPGLKLEKFEYDHTMFWPAYLTFSLRRWVWLTSPRMTAFHNFLHKRVIKLTPEPLQSHTFWRLRKKAC